MLNHCSTVRMTASRAAEIFRTATPINAAQLTEQHLDMLSCDPSTSIAIRLDLGDAADAIRVGNRRAQAVRRSVAAFNARCGR